MPRRQSNADAIATAIDGWAVTTARLESALRGFFGDWAAPSACGDWSNRELLAHLATGYVVRIAILEAAVSGERMPAAIDIDDVHATNVARARNTAPNYLIGVMLDNRARIAALLSKLEPESLGRATPLAPKSTLRSSLEMLSDHDLEHLRQLRS